MLTRMAWCCGVAPKSRPPLFTLAHKQVSVTLAMHTPMHTGSLLTRHAFESHLALAATTHTHSIGGVAVVHTPGLGAIGPCPAIETFADTVDAVAMACAVGKLSGAWSLLTAAA